MAEALYLQHKDDKSLENEYVDLFSWTGTLFRYRQPGQLCPRLIKGVE